MRDQHGFVLKQLLDHLRVPSGRRVIHSRTWSSMESARVRQEISFGKTPGVRIGLVWQAYVTRYGLVQSDEEEEKKRA